MNNPLDGKQVSDMCDENKADITEVSVQACNDVHLSEISAKNGKRVGIIELNSPSTLNALSLGMVDAISPALTRWEHDPDIACVFLSGAGEKAFCAGGDIRSLYEGMNGDRDANFCLDFFTREYRMDYHIHQYKKPLICWGQGHVIGGGIGMMSGCRYRVVTETSRLSMPEVSIGLYPDVAGSWFLNRMPGTIGLFLALTGAPLNARDALLMGMADYCLASATRESILSRLQGIDWSDNQFDNHDKVNELLMAEQEQSMPPLPQSQVIEHFDVINALLRGQSISQKVDRLLGHSSKQPWFEKAQLALSKGSPSSAAIIDQQLFLTQFYSLAEVYQSELNLSMNCADDGEFAEGIRALIIDKDNQPKWRFNNAAEVDPNWLSAMFTARWDPQSHPLSGLD